MRFDKIEIDDDDMKNWDIGYVNTMEDVQKYIDKFTKEGITFQTDRMIEDAKYAQEHYMIMKRKENTDKLERMYDVTTDTWYVQKGDCPYCGIRLYSNNELSDYNYESVQTNDNNKIISICRSCVKHMKNSVLEDL